MARNDMAALRRRLKALQEAKKKPWNPLDALMPHQRAFFLDQTPNRCLTGSRQFGKSTIATISLIDASINKPNSQSAYVDMSIEHGGKVIWKEVERVLSEFQVPAKVVDNELKFENGSTVYLFSGEPSEVKKLQGLRLALLIIDEAQECNALDDILTMVAPALMRHGGRVMLMGIPGRVAKIGPWWNATEGENAHLYGQHRGTFRDNTALDPVALEQLFELEKGRLGENNPDFLRHWLGKWPSLDSANRVYLYDPAVNGYDGEPPLFNQYSLGLDPGGVKDSEAVVVVGHGYGLPAYHVDEVVSAKKEGGSWDDSADRVGPLVDRWNPSTRYYDYGSAHKSALSLIYQKSKCITMEAVPGKSPYDEARQINALFAQRKLFIKRGSKLEQDLLYCAWDAESLGGGGQKPKYSRAYKQDAADALRCAMWAVWSHSPPERMAKLPLSDVEAEAKRIADGDAYKQAAKATRSAKYAVPGTAALDPAKASRVTDRFGRVRRGY